MFNPKRILAFYSKIILITLPLLAMLILLSMLAVWYANAPAFLSDRMFWLLVIFNIIPGLIAVWIACNLPARFMRSLYGLNDTMEGFRFLVRCWFDRPAFRPLVIVEEGTINRGSDTIKQIGGPGGLLVYDDSAAILERGGRITRVLKPGFYELRPFERVWETFDLRPHRWPYSVDAMTLEGIPITCKADIRFKINDGGQAPTEASPHPVSTKAILQAAFCKWIREPDRSEEDRLMEWDKRVIISYTEGTLRSILARYPLDELIEPSGRREIRDKLSAALSDSVPNLGAQIIKVELGDITVQDDVTQQWIERWQVEKHREAETLIAIGEAEGIRIAAQAQSDVKLEIYQQAASILEDLKKEYGSDIPPRVVGLCFADMIRKMSSKMPYLPDDVLRTLGLLEEQFNKPKSALINDAESSRKSETDTDSLTLPPPAPLS
ncbi:MAG: SPFH domain-containing protein [Chloroflexota bacterium]|nr:SPFH domain-containing protein [Chloroflexota bacterium]